MFLYSYCVLVFSLLLSGFIIRLSLKQRNNNKKRTQKQYKRVHQFSHVVLLCSRLVVFVFFQEHKNKIKYTNTFVRYYSRTRALIVVFLFFRENSWKKYKIKKIRTRTCFCIFLIVPFCPYCFTLINLFCYHVLLQQPETKKKNKNKITRTEQHKNVLCSHLCILVTEFLCSCRNIGT